MKAILTMIRCIRIRRGSSSSFPYNTPRDFSPRVREFLYTQRLPTRPAIYHGLVCGSASHPLIEWVHIPSSGLRTPGVPEKTLGTFSELRHARDDAPTNKSIVMPDPKSWSLLRRPAKALILCCNKKLNATVLVIGCAITHFSSKGFCSCVTPRCTLRFCKV